MNIIDCRELIREGQTKQFSKIPDETPIIINLNNKYRIGLSLAEKQYMLRGKVEEGQDNNQVQIQIGNSSDPENYLENSTLLNSTIQLGKTYRYETEISGVSTIFFPRGFPYGLIFELTCLGSVV